MEVVILQGRIEDMSLNIEFSTELLVANGSQLYSMTY